METVTWRVTGMTCGGCENAVTRALARLEGVRDVTASHVDAQVAVTFDPATVTIDQIRAKVATLGYTVVG